MEGIPLLEWSWSTASSSPSAPGSKCSLKCECKQRTNAS